jgi:hypothetical protein
LNFQLLYQHHLANQTWLKFMEHQINIISNNWRYLHQPFEDIINWINEQLIEYAYQMNWNFEEIFNSRIKWNWWYLQVIVDIFNYLSLCWFGPPYKSPLGEGDSNLFKLEIKTKINTNIGRSFINHMKNHRAGVTERSDSRRILPRGGNFST